MRVAIIRGTYSTNFELENYAPLQNKHNLVAITGLRSINKKLPIVTKKLLSPVDLPNFPYKMPILNRIFMGDAMYLYGLEKNLAGFDIAHVRETYFHFTSQALNAKAGGLVKAVVSTCSETIPFNHEGIWNRKKFKQRAIKEVDMFHCHTNQSKDCLIKEGCDPDKIVVFPYGVNLNKFKPHKALVINHQQSVIKILYVGRLVKEKGIDDLINAFWLLSKQTPNIKLKIIGKGCEEENLKQLVRKLKLENLIEIKQSKYKNIYRQYQKSNIFCLLSKPTKHWQEYSSRALTEALASGLPCVVTDNGGNSSFIGKAGFVVKPGDYKTAYKYLLSLIKNHKLRKKLSILARKKAEKELDNKKTAKKIEMLWSAALK